MQGFRHDAQAAGAETDDELEHRDCDSRKHGILRDLAFLQSHELCRCIAFRHSQVFHFGMGSMLGHYI